MAKATKQAKKKRAKVTVEGVPGSYDWSARVSLDGGPYNTFIGHGPSIRQAKDAKRAAERTMAKLGIEIVQMDVIHE